MKPGVRGKRFIATAVGTALIVPAVVMASGGPKGTITTSDTYSRLKFSSSPGPTPIPG